MALIKSRFFIFLLTFLAVSVPVVWHVQNQKALNENLISAVSRKDDASVRNLLARGANPNAIGPDDFTQKLWNETTTFRKVAGQLSGWSHLIVKPVLITAVESKNITSVNLLLSKGANVESRTERDETALMRATDGDNTAVLRSLLKNGADVNARDNSENTALMWAAFWGNYEAIKILASKGADLNAQRSDGTTALMYVAPDKDKINVAALLLRLGAEPNIKDIRGQSAFTRAKQQHNVAMIELFKRSAQKK